VSDLIMRPPAGNGEMTRSQKAAAVLIAVGPEAAQSVLAHLSEAEVEQVMLEVATLQQVPGDRMQGVLREFYDEALAQRELISGSEQQARELMRRLRGDDADEIVDRLLAQVEAVPFHFLRLREPAELVQHLHDEHPQTLAMILSHLPTKFAAQVLAGLEPGLQGEVAWRVATMEATSPDVVARVESALRERLGAGMAERRGNAQGGVRELASMLNHSDRGTERAILSTLEAENPELAEEVRALMFLFEDIVTLEARAIQETLRQVEIPRLALALKGVRDDVHRAVVENLSQRAREVLEEELDLLGPARIKDVEAAQTEIVRLIRRLEEDGTIVTNRGVEGELVE
jgi:flagellar motor switch protein FliG